MKIAAVVMLIIAALSMGAVRSGSLYRSDATTFSNALINGGVHSDVSIMRNAGGTHYVAYFPYRYSLDNNIYEVLVIAIAVGQISSSTTWSSDLAIAVFRNEVVAISTANCRRIVNMINAGYSDAEVIYFYANNSYTLERELSAL